MTHVASLESAAAPTLLTAMELPSNQTGVALSRWRNSVVEPLGNCRLRSQTGKMAAHPPTGDSTVMRRVALTICWPGSGATLAIGKRKSERLRLPPAFVPTNSVAPLPLLVDVPSSKLCGK